MYTKIKQGGDVEDQRISYEELLDYVSFLSQLFRAEFIFPTTSLDENLHHALLGLKSDRIVSTSRRSGVSNEIDYIELHADERALGRDNFDFYNFLLVRIRIVHNILQDLQTVRASLRTFQDLRDVHDL